MNKAEFQAAFDLAVSDETLDEAIDLFLGFATRSFQPICVTLRAAARCIRWQCVYLNGGIDQDALDECRRHFRHKVQVV